ncbi:MAG TPA: type II toxin-antitoxin system RatA family toxin [Burkholderiaceae bacterium]|nr:type II toxin-antitoxin system RatA family toxin [Burkholderiaceae bacterium]
MLHKRVERVLPYAPERVFDLAADVERYPEFLRWWIAARVCRREGNICYATQTLGLGPIRLRFDSIAVFQRPQRIEVRAKDSFPFREFRIIWGFTPAGERDCRAELAVEFEIAVGPLRSLVEHVTPLAIADTIAAFETRARTIYGVLP